MPRVTVEFDAWEVLDEISTKELVKELSDRAGRGDTSAKFADVEADWLRLEDYIAEGRTRDALDLLFRLRPGLQHPSTAIGLSLVRGRA